jgi:hypothetical protein
MTKDIRVFPRPTGNPEIQYSGSAHSSIKFEVLESGSISFSGASGSLFSISDSLIGSLFSVNDISGLPVIEAFSDDRVVMGSFGQNTLVVTGSLVGIGTSVPTSLLHVDGTGHSATGNPTFEVITSAGETATYGSEIRTLGGNRAALLVEHSHAAGDGRALVINSANSTGDILQVQDGGVVKFVIHDGGNVGIGTSSTDRNLHLYGGNAGTDPTWNVDDMFIIESDTNQFQQFFGPTTAQQ